LEHDIRHDKVLEQKSRAFFYGYKTYVNKLNWQAYSLVMNKDYHLIVSLVIAVQD